MGNGTGYRVLSFVFGGILCGCSLPLGTTQGSYANTYDPNNPYGSTYGYTTGYSNGYLPGSYQPTYPNGYSPSYPNGYAPTYGTSVSQSMALARPGGLSITPATITVKAGQTMQFRTSGGTPPYHFQVSGGGSIDASGKFLASSKVGQAQIQVWDSQGTAGFANVNVVQTASGNYAMRAATGPIGWQPTNTLEERANPFIQGAIVGVDDEHGPGGERVHSKFIETGLKHSLVRVDEEIENKQIVAVRAVVEDQFVVKLLPGYSTSDLSTLLAQLGAHVSKRLDFGTYLISLDSAPTGLDFSADLLTKRKALRQKLESIAEVRANAILSRAPAKQ
jgi:hypothetical protein